MRCYGVIVLRRRSHRRSARRTNQDGCPASSADRAWSRRRGHALLIDSDSTLSAAEFAMGRLHIALQSSHIGEAQAVEVAVRRQAHARGTAHAASRSGCAGTGGQALPNWRSHTAHSHADPSISRVRSYMSAAIVVARDDALARRALAATAAFRVRRSARRRRCDVVRPRLRRAGCSPNRRVLPRQAEYQVGTDRVESGCLRRLDCRECLRARHGFGSGSSRMLSFRLCTPMLNLLTPAATSRSHVRTIERAWIRLQRDLGMCGAGRMMPAKRSQDPLDSRQTGSLLGVPPPKKIVGRFPCAGRRRAQRQFRGSKASTYAVIWPSWSA